MVRCHLPPRGVGIPRSFNSPAMALTETKPAFRSLRIVGPKASARMSATRLLISPLLIPSCPDVSRSRRRTILSTVLRCHLPPKAVGIPLRFNSFASPRWETKPAAMSLRMVGSKARARVSARLADNVSGVPLLRDEVPSLTCFIGPSTTRMTPLHLQRHADHQGQPDQSHEETHDSRASFRGGNHPARVSPCMFDAPC